ncbi:MAG: hypothetical protein M3367_03275 [Acidobacteriota bacterium]|nr:hypothetical protein [Acidobacteriota bacterium]
MQDSKSVITEAAKGIVEKLAAEYEVSLPRMYEILSSSCPYPKTKRLIRAIAHIDKKRARIIKADLDAMFAQILNEPPAEINIVEFHRESAAAVQANLEHRPTAEQLKDFREVAALSQQAISILERNDILH